MKRISPLGKLTLSLVLMMVSLVLMANLFLSAVPAGGQSERQSRQQVATALAAQLTVLLPRDDPALVRQSLLVANRQVDGLRSVAVRRSAGELVAESGGHAQHWRSVAEPLAHQFSVPLATAGGHWGQVELAFEPDPRPVLWRWADQPIVHLLGFVAVAGVLVFGLYLRRALQHLDPSSVVPDRVQRAFDVMSDGVAVLDARGRVMLVNRAFQGLHPQAATVRPGQTLASLPWLASGLKAFSDGPPWTRAISQRAPTGDDLMQIGQDTDQPRQLVISAAPITDARGTVRGCLATFDDVTELHRANTALRQAMQESSAAREEVQRKNIELERLATRDPMTGALNRRALYERLNPLFERARQEGSPIGCLVLDIDHFKSVNDTHGHSIGDRVIQEVARKMTECARATDLVCRYGGEEFVMVAVGLSRERMLELAEEVRQRIERECGPGVREVPGMRVTASIGCQPAGLSAANPQSMIDQADQALYIAKRGGRNRVVSADTAEQALAA